MMDTAVLHVPLSSTLRSRAEETASREGFSSLQEVIRVFLSQFAAAKIGVAFQPKVMLSVENDRRYAQMISEVKNGKVKTTKFDEVDKLIDYLNR